MISISNCYKNSDNDIQSIHNIITILLLSDMDNNNYDNKYTIIMIF